MLIDMLFENAKGILSSDYSINKEGKILMYNLND